MEVVPANAFEETELTLVLRQVFVTEARENWSSTAVIFGGREESRSCGPRDNIR